MTEPGFRIEGRQQTAPFLARSTFPDYHSFGDAACAVLVRPDAARDMHDAAVRALPRETGGLLSGRALRDDLGSYVVVSGFIEAPPNAGRPAAFEITTGELGELRTHAARANPGADEVGWWHTHPRLSSYSQTDRNTQRMFERPDSVGLLVFASGTHWAVAYLGPDAHDLGYPSIPGRGHAAELAATVGQAQPPAQPAGPRDRAGYPNGGDPPAGPAPRRVLDIPRPPPVSRRLNPQTIVLITLVLLLALMLIMLFKLVGMSSLSGQVGSLQQQVSGQLRQLASQDSGNYKKLSAQVASARGPSAAPVVSPSPVVTAASVSWSCVHQGTGTFDCAAVSSPGTASWKVEWLVNGKSVGPGRSNVPIGPLAKAAQVQAVLVSPKGDQYPGPTQTLSP
jgi:hypothetical protein